jgi:hypothetical protein
MNNGEARLYRRLRIAGSLIIIGLAVEALSLIRVHPLAFLAFMFIGGACLIAGVALYLYAIVTSPPTHENNQQP